MKVVSLILIGCASMIVGLASGHADYGFAVAFGLLAIVLAMPDDDREK